MPADYQIGYGKPPRHKRFRKGRSGNPRGRPKGTRNLKTDLLEELGERVLLREGSAEKRLSKQRALVKSLVTKAIKGDTRAASIVLDMVWRHLQAEGADEVEAPLTSDERAVLEGLETRLLRQAGAPEDTGADDAAEQTRPAGKGRRRRRTKA